MKQFFILLLSIACCMHHATAQTFIKDTDGNTKVETEASPNEDVVRISTKGIGRMNINGNATGLTVIDIPNSNQSILMGTGAGLNMTTGTFNVAIGQQAGLFMTSCFNNVFLGAIAGKQTTTGNQNVAVGGNALENNTTGGGNVAIGDKALSSLTTATSNTAVGRNALLNNTIGNFNVAMGINAGDGATFNVDCTYLGTDADNTIAGNNLTNSTALGFSSRLTASNQVRIGNSSVTSIGGFANWTNVSDGRVKKNIRENVPGLDFVLQLRPVTYNLDVNGINRRLHRDIAPEEQAAVKEKEQVLYSGFIAQEVEKAAQQLHYDFSGVDAPKNDDDLYGLRYAEFVVPMVKAIQEQQTQLDAQKAEIESLKSMVAQLLAREGNTASDLQVWPNPAGATVQVSVTGATSGALLNLFSTDGKLLHMQPAQEGTQVVDLKSVASGSCMLQLSIPGRQPVTRMVVKVQ